MSVDSDPAVQIYLLGRFQVSRGDCSLRETDWQRRKAATLLQCLALERRLTKDQAIELLWPDASLSAGSNNLYPILHALRQTLDSALGVGAAELTFSFKDGVLSLDERTRVDAHEFRRAAQLALNASPPAQTQLEAALDLYGGDLLPSRMYDEWTLYARDDLRRLYREINLVLSGLRRNQGDYAGAIALLTPLLEHNLSDEVVHRELMRTYAYAGRRHDALRQYQACVKALSEELAVVPEAETRAIYDQLLRGDFVSSVGVSISRMPEPAGLIEAASVSPFVGRQTELETLVAWFAEVRKRGHGKTIFLAGDAGVGKTRLAHEALRTAVSAGEMIVLKGAAYEQEGQLPYQPFIEAFDDFLAQAGNADVQNPILHFKKLGNGDPQQEQWALFNSAAAFLTRLARETLLIFLIDDLHAADETSLHLFHFLARQTRQMPVILIATYRIGADPTGLSSFNVLLNALYREGLSETLYLSPLTETQVCDILRHLLGDTPDDALIRAVFEITEGNPFFVQEITYGLIKSQQVEQRDKVWTLKSGLSLSVPSGLSGLLRERVARLGASATSILSAAAVIGREFDFDILRRIVTYSDGEVLDTLDAALAAHLVEETGSAYHFSHGLIRQTLYQSLSQARLARLHTSVAEAIAASKPHQIDTFVEELAFHYLHSDQRARALDYLLQAGRKAANVYAFEVAVDYFERALALMDEVHIVDPEKQWRVLESLGWWCGTLADAPRAVSYFERALALSADAGWQPSNRERARLHRRAATVLITVGNLEAAEQHLRSGLAQIDENEDAREYARILYNVAQFHWHQGQYREAFDAAQRSLAIAERMNDAKSLARAFEMLALACHSLGKWQEGLSYEQHRSALVGAALDVSEAFDVHL